ncbi:DUF1302 domain-containing protein [Sansalvadorimonas verongulae]|uniref:DUF1302 domain-containing protein n=1 Tax=Sansalvadorimonas verongulae TaxID=2172824 RepID=UPI0012BB6601|nr:DUF1302 domain-containing protein [Sansalvadorimonas verongulae]MTI15387.1 DUF1302 domain-containing protein [Sansalvadorimonas verongulae]
MKLRRISVSTPIHIAPAKAGFALASILAVAPVQAVEFDLMDGNVSGSLDTTVSYGAMWRVQGQDKNNDSMNGNDGNRNYDTGIVSQVYKITSDLELNYENYGLFARGTAFYDSELGGSTNYGKKSWHADQPSQAQNANPNNPANRFTKDARDISGKDAQLLDAYVYGSWDVMDRPVDVRLGKQVLSWGEGIFYRNGINTTNPLDAAKFRLPGSELKEALIPVETFGVSIGLTDNLSMDAFYQFNFRKTQIDPVGTYFAETDLFAEGGNTAYTQSLGTAERPVIQGYAGSAAVQSGALRGLGITGEANTSFSSIGVTQVARIGKDINASDDGQFGVSFRYVAEELNDTEFGFYFVNYHNKEPLIYAKLDKDFTGVDIATLTGALTPDYGSAAGTTAQGLATIELLDNVEANRKYVEDIRVYGFSFSTTYGNTSFAGEVAYRPNLPIGIATTNDLLGDMILQGGTVADGDTGLIAGETVALGGEVNNYERVESYNISLSAIHNFGPVMSFDSLFGIVEVASEHLRGSNFTYNSIGGERKFAGRGDCAYVDFNSGECNEDDQISKNAYGYSAVLAGSWNDVYAGVTLNPYLRWSQDVKGNSHRTGNFLEGKNSMTIGMKAQYLDLEGEIQYTEFTGPGTYSQRDRDNISIGVKYSF